MNIHAVSKSTPPARFGFSMTRLVTKELAAAEDMFLGFTPSGKALVGTLLKSIGSVYRVQDVKENPEMRRATIRRESALAAISFAFQYTFESLLSKVNMKSIEARLGGGGFAQRTVLALKVAPFAIGYIAAEILSRKLSGYNSAVNSAFQGKPVEQKKHNPFSLTHSGMGLWRQPESSAVFEARLHNAPWTVSPHRQDMSLVPRY